MSKGKPSSDFFTRLFAFFLGITYLWVILTPFVPAVSLAGMRRFNLLTESFPGWALQQPVPSMYNFVNHAVFTPQDLEQKVVPVAMNHYPTRYYTFRYRSTYSLILPQELETSSSYQGKKVEARYVIKKMRGGGSEMILESD